MKFEFKNPKSGDILYLEVLETFEHYYTKKKIYRCRVHNRDGYSSEWSFDQEEFEEVLENRIKKPIGYVIFKTGHKVEIVSTGFSIDAIMEFSTTMFKYRFNPYDKDLSLVHEFALNPAQTPTFERWNSDTGVWITASGIDRVEFFDQKEVTENDQT